MCAQFLRTLRKLAPEVKEFRRVLHKYPRVSGDEAETAARIQDFLQLHGGPRPPVLLHRSVNGSPGLIYAVHGTGSAAASCESILFRADMDALPLHEANTNLPHVSARQGAHHACGHDGHTAMLAGALLALNLHCDQISGTVYAIFQPAEETGHGAKQMVEAHPELLAGKLVTKGVYGFHNIPGSPLGEVSMSPSKVAARASCGVIIDMVGEASHASEPKLGRSPMATLTRLANEMEGLPDQLEYEGAIMKQIVEPALVTPVHLQVGHFGDFGIFPSNGRLCITCRADTSQDLDSILRSIQYRAEQMAAKDELQVDISHVERFPSVHNDPVATKLVANAVRTVNENSDEEFALSFRWRDRPFPWSEDFGFYSSGFGESGGAAFIGLGAGTEHPPLHNKMYDFPDDLLPKGMLLWCSIAMEGLGSSVGHMEY